MTLSSAAVERSAGALVLLQGSTAACLFDSYPTRNSSSSTHATLVAVVPSLDPLDPRGRLRDVARPRSLRLSHLAGQRCRQALGLWHSYVPTLREAVQDLRRLLPGILGGQHAYLALRPDDAFAPTCSRSMPARPRCRLSDPTGPPNFPGPAAARVVRFPYGHDQSCCLRERVGRRKS
jgi:hypothetical protein